MNTSRLTLSAGAVAVAGAAALALAAPATAASYPHAVSVNYSCPAKDITFSFTVTAPSTVWKGKSFTVSVSGDIGPHDEGSDLPANAIDAELQLVLGGAGSGSVEATGLTNADPVPLGDEILVSGGTATITPTASGTLTLTPGTFDGTAAGNQDTCTVVGTAPVASSIIVKS